MVFPFRVKPGSVIPDYKASATAGHMCLTLGPEPWNQICHSSSQMAQASLVTSGKEISKCAPSQGQSCGHMHVPLPHWGVVEGAWFLATCLLSHPLSFA